MRVTSNSFSNQLIGQLGTLAGRQARLQNQAATGQRISLPEDDPRAMRRVLDMQTHVRALDQYDSNISRLKESSTAAYTAMKALKNNSDRSSEIATAADGLSSKEELTAFAAEINEILESALNTANSKHGGDYLFAGTHVDQPPFVAVRDAEGKITAVNYTGNTDVVAAEISPGVLSEAQPLGANSSGSGGRGLLADSRSGADVFAHLISLRDHLIAGDTTAIAANDLKNLQKDEENFIYHYSHTGATQGRLEAASNLAKDQSFAVEQQISGLVDADLAQTMVRLNQVQNAYTAALQSGGNILNTTLLDYLR